MGVFASILVLAAVNGIVLHEGLHLPCGALLLVIVINLGLPSIVLPIVCIDTGIPGVVSITVGAPDSLEVEHVEIVVSLLHQVKQLDSQLALTVCEGAHISVLAMVESIRVGLAEFDLVLFWVVEFLYSIMRT